MLDPYLFDDLPENPCEAAVELARRGKSVFPCDPTTKRPLTDHGFHDASRDDHQVADMFRSKRCPAIGLPTGRVNGLVVVDIDVPGAHAHDGFATFDFLAEQGFTIPESPVQVRTASGGRHIYLRCSHIEIKSRSNIAPGIDIRGEGGYVICPPSRRPDGSRWEVFYE